MTPNRSLHLTASAFALFSPPVSLSVIGFAAGQVSFMFGHSNRNPILHDTIAEDIPMFTGLILASLALGGGKEAKAAEPAYEFKLSSPGDSVATVQEASRTVFVVTCPNGIGQGTIILKAGQWPENVTLRFQRKQAKGLGKLEHLGITTDRISAQGDLKSSGKFDFGFLDAKGKPGTERRSAGVLNVVVESRDGALDVTLPARLLIGSTQVELSWVDAFRR